MSDRTQKPLLERDNLETELADAGFTQVSGGVLPDNLMWSVYQHSNEQSGVPRCLWVITNLEPPVCHLGANWTDAPDHAFDQVMTYIQIWLMSPDSFASLRTRTKHRFAVEGVPDDPMLDDGSKPSTLIQDTAKVALNEVVKKIVTDGLGVIKGMNIYGGG